MRSKIARRTRLLLLTLAALLIAVVTPSFAAPPKPDPGVSPKPLVGKAGLGKVHHQSPLIEGDPIKDPKPLPPEAKGVKNQKEADKKTQIVQKHQSKIKHGLSCDELRGDPGKRKGAVCIEEEASAATPSTTDESMVPSGVVWCDGAAPSIQVTRFSLCSVREWEVLVWDTDGSELGTADFTTEQEIDTKPRASDFMEQFFFRVDRMDPALAGVTVSADTVCNYLSGCADDGLGPWTGAVPLPPPGTWLDGTVHRSWTGANGYDDIYINWDLTFTKPGGKNSTVTWGGIDYEIRCDDLITADPGCVFPDYKPTYVIDGASYPGAKDFIGRAQASMSSHPGWAGMGQPLHREADAEIRKKNRNKVCDTSATWVKEDRFGEKVYPDDESIECDEWPFAATKESGGQLGIESGAECQQWTVWPGGTGSGWPSTNYAVQAWTKSGIADCARASMPRRENGGVGTGLSNLYQGQRILDNDAFWLDSGAAAVEGDPGPTKTVDSRSCTLQPPAISDVTPGVAPQSSFLDYARTTPNGWTGGDSAYSVELPDGRDLWLFSDTFLGPLNADGTRPTSAQMINSSFVLQDGSSLTTITGGSTATPKALVSDSTSGHWFWLGDGQIANRSGTNYLQVIFQEYYRYGSGDWDWGWYGSVLATFSLSDLSTPQSVVVLPSAAGISWGSGILPSSASGDGYTYVYGVDDSAIKKSMRIARVHGSDLNARWEFLDPANNRWVLDERRTSNSLTGVANEYSVTPWNGEFMLLTQDSNLAFNAKVYTYTACDPAGTFQNPVEAYTMPETGLWGRYGDENIFAYNAHVHRELTTGGDKFTFSYSVNSFDNRVDPDGAHYRDPSIYKPRWVSFIAKPLLCPPQC